MAEGFTIRGRYRDFTLYGRDLLNLYLYMALWLVILLAFPNGLHNPFALRTAWVIGGFGLWRYSWWTLNFIRSQYYGRWDYPRLRAEADAVWRTGWRPPHVHFIMTTFHEHADTTWACLESLHSEVKACGISATLWIGTGAGSDEAIIGDWLKQAAPAPLEVAFVRQNLPGKRVAIGLALRALSRSEPDPHSLAVLLDGDSILEPGCLARCLSVMGAFPRVGALTTDEDAICDDSVWLQKWLSMRFAQRRMWMQSHALSRRVLTLTGRFSVFRTASVTDPGFIRIVETDHLDHWFWGSFRFLSGDDKSTWYYMLTRDADMLYLPDAMVYTIERVPGSAVRRALDNTLRWSGNMLRNGLRAIALGPRKMPPYIWWCLIDQRITIWTTLAGFFAAMSVAHFVDSSFFVTYLLWIMFTRFCMSAAFFLYSDRIRMSFPFILYCNQLGLAFVKAYLMFRLPQQRWANRLDQKSGDELIHSRVNRIFPLYLNVFYAVLLMAGVLLATGVLQWPDFNQVF